MLDSFGKALLDPQQPVPSGVIRPDGTPASKRFDVYRNNVVHSLILALADGYPTAKKLVGDAFFDAVAAVYVRAHPPKSPLMIFYGDDFAAFLDGFPPAAQVPYLADIARLEWARRAAYHAADDPHVDITALAQIDEAALMSLRLEFHASTGLVASPHPILSIWSVNQGRDETIEAQAQSVLVTRPADQVLVTLCPTGGDVFIREMIKGATLEAAVAAAQPAGFDLSAGLGVLFGSGAVARLLTN